ncbi:MAG: hypothetical protein ACUVX1_15275 [Chloroflexota bacterium]
MTSGEGEMAAALSRRGAESAAGPRLGWLVAAGFGLEALLVGFILLYVNVPAGYNSPYGLSLASVPIFRTLWPYPTLMLEPRGFTLAATVAILGLWLIYVCASAIVSRRLAGDPVELEDLASAEAVGPGEWRWLAMVVAATLLAVEVPYLLTQVQAARGVVFTGMFWSPHDLAQFLAAMREGAAGSLWLIHDHLTGEPHSPALMYVPYVALGKLAGAIGLDFQQAYHLFELASRAVLIVSIYLFCCTMLRELRQRRLALALIAFSSGLELCVPEFSTFLAMFTAPHLMLGLASILLGARFYTLSWLGRPLTAVMAAGLATLGLGLTHSFSLVTLGVVVAVHLGLSWLMGARPPRTALAAAGAMFLTASPFVLYSLLVFGMDPFWSVVYGRQNVTPTPSIGLLVLSLGPFLILAGLGLRDFTRQMTPGRWLVLVWIIASVILMYAPVGYQRRFAFGLQPMLGIVGAGALESTWNWVRQRGRLPLRADRFLLTLSLLMALACGPLLLYVVVMRGAISPTIHAATGSPQGLPAGTYQPIAVRDAALWLATVMGPDDVVLAETQTGNYLAGMVPGRVYVGHWSATMNYAAKERAMRWFYRGEGDEMSRARFLKENNIAYVWYGPRERALGPPPSLSGGGLGMIYSGGDVCVYEVRMKTTAASLCD